MTAITYIDDQAAVADNETQPTEDSEALKLGKSEAEINEILDQIQEFTDDIKTRVKDTPLVADGMKTFL